MSKAHKGPNPPNEEQVTKISSARKMLLIAIVVGIVIGIAYWINEDAGDYTYVPDIESVEEPAFVKEGELVFLEQNTADTLAHIAIEVADDDSQRSQGLMYRSSMEDSTGMLFIFDEARPQSFWMKNTKIPLDIMYVSEDSTIFMIYKSVMPYSEKSIPSEENALYVVEVNGGFTNRNNIEQGDKIAFELE
ncbi:uncharacterized membrane protein (UPF0127 family) [Catalinimonas alkaloidigena]|uniref:DUF192 domain-containing protein n=1 Tax=Catalinimonas alkaloidigena TaxID=1075417 RepID=UPI002405D438|nr:DUF192 domain-containing protein [Catalinimonas alkaloidigena]MDF9798120.1 uncharacterized membrane protein (UPF0127 family) [Catalinimonas alkaloidigena]